MNIYQKLNAHIEQLEVDLFKKLVFVILLMFQTHAVSQLPFNPPSLWVTDFFFLTSIKPFLCFCATIVCTSCFSKIVIGIKIYIPMQPIRLLILYNRNQIYPPIDGFALIKVGYPNLMLQTYIYLSIMNYVL